VHNIVNHRLGHEQFDCSTVLNVWKCGCSDEALENLEEERARLIQEGTPEAKANTLVEEKRKALEDQSLPAIKTEKLTKEETLLS
jgi:hypothetical protein